MEKKRDYSIDAMRAIGLILIILAHTITYGNTLFQIRTFDVPMMAVVSGMSFMISCPEKLNLKSYYFKRVIRLLLPTWTFLSLFFGIALIYALVTGKDYLFEGKVLGSYLLYNGGTSIGYVWIIRVFLLIALTAPLLIWLWRTTKNILAFGMVMVVLFMLYQLAVLYVPSANHPITKTLINTYLYSIIPYSVLFGFGMILTQLRFNKRLILVIVLIPILVGIICWQHDGSFIFTPQNYKYPARSYFAVWGLLMSSLLALLTMKVVFTGKLLQFIKFTSSRSLWIYFWHIVIIYLLEPLSLSKSNGLLFIAVLILSLIVTMGHIRVFQLIAKKTEGSKVINWFVVNSFLK